MSTTDLRTREGWPPPASAWPAATGASDAIPGPERPARSTLWPDDAPGPAPNGPAAAFSPRPNRANAGPLDAVVPAARRGRSRLTWRLARLVGATVAAVLAATLLLLDVAARESAAAASRAGLERTTRLVDVMLSGRERALARAADVFAQNPAFRAILAEGRPGDLHDQASEAAERTGASWVQLVDARGVRVARSDDPAAPLVALGGSALVQGALAGRATRGVGAAGDTGLFQVVAVPVAVPAARTGAGTGALMAAQTVDLAFAREVARLAASDVVFFVVDTAGRAHVVASSLTEPARWTGAPWSDALRPALTAAAATAAAHGGAPTAVTLGGVRYVGHVAPLRSAGGELLGGFAALRSADAERAPFAALRRRLILAGLLGLALGLALSLRAARTVARPVLALAAAARRAAAGDYTAGRVGALAGTDDEIGALDDAMRTMLADLRAKEALVTALRGRPAPTPATTSTAAPWQPPGGAGTAAPGAAGDGAPDTTADAAPNASPNATPNGALGAAPHADAAAAPAPGRLLAGRYALRRVLGSGGAGVVFEAFDRALGEAVAVKTLRPEALAGDPAAVERLKGELRLARRITHRNVVRTHDLGADAGTHFITMELVAGTTLHALLARDGRLAVAAAVAIGEQLCRALEVAHAAGVVHRDVKPSNLMVEPDGTLKVMDFGIARLADVYDGPTRAGMVVGTPAYMAPEQLMGEAVDARADLYATGVVLYRCLTGRAPFAAESTAALVARILAGRPEPPHLVAPGVPPALSALVVALLAPDPADRPPSAAAVRALLARDAA